MSKSIIVTQDGKKFKVLVGFIQRGIEFSSPQLANQEALKLCYKENVNRNDVMLFKEN